MLDEVSTSSCASPGKEKLAGERLNSLGIEELKSPEACTRGSVLSIANPGTRGIVTASTTAMLCTRRQSKYQMSNAAEGRTQQLSQT